MYWDIRPITSGREEKLKLSCYWAFTEWRNYECCLNSCLKIIMEWNSKNVKYFYLLSSEKCFYFILNRLFWQFEGVGYRGPCCLPAGGAVTCLRWNRKMRCCTKIFPERRISSTCLWTVWFIFICFCLCCCLLLKIKGQIKNLLCNQKDFYKDDC